MELPVNYNEIDQRQRKSVREQYSEIQKGNCYYCDAPLSGDPAKKGMRYVKRSLFPKGFFKWPVHLHHCHKTGMTIGSVHSSCNAVLWVYHNE